MFATNPENLNLSKMDLFCVAEIRKPKDGAMEIKFVDRLKALEKLEHFESGENCGMVFETLEKTAGKIWEIEAKEVEGV